MINLLWSGVFMVMLLSGCGWNGTPTRKNDFTQLTSITINADYSTIASKTSAKLTATGNFSGFFTRDITELVVWTSNAPAVARFASTASPNRVTGVAPGPATLTATVNGISATYALTVSSATVTAMTITPSAPTIFKGLSSQLAVSGTFSDSTTQVLTFDADWTSSTPTVATVGNDAAGKGFARAIAIGTTTISAALGGITGTTVLTVTEPVLQSITVTPANPSILSLSSGSFAAKGNYSDGSTADLTGQVTWSSSQPGIAAITAGGAVKTLSQGITSISAAAPNGVNGATSLKVTGGTLTGIILNPANVTLVKDVTRNITATGTFNNGSTRDITAVVTWTPANAALAIVTLPGGNLGLLNPLALTSTPTTITAASGTVSNTTTVTVIAPQLVSVAFNVTSLALIAGTGSPLTVSATYSDATTQDVTAISTWKSFNEAIATVGASGHSAGRVTGVAAGTTTISATYGGFTVPTPATVTVSARTLQSLTITGPSSVTAGNQVSFTALATYSDTSSAFVTENTAWSIDKDKSNVAFLADSANQPGEVVGVDSGTATLTAKFNGLTQTATVTVP